MMTNNQTRHQITQRRSTVVFKHQDSKAEYEGDVCELPIEKDSLMHVPGVWETFATLLLAGGIAGATGRIVTAPLKASERTFIHEGLQRRVITLRENVSSTLGTYKALGFRHFLVGHEPSMIRAVPYGAFLFASHEMWKRFLRVTPRSFRLKKMCAGSLAGVTAVTVTYPLDLWRSRVNARVTQDYVGLRSGLKSMWKEGWRGMFRGYIPSVVGVIPYCGVKFYLYDNLKFRYFEKTSERPGLLVYCAYGTLAAVVGQTVAYPFEVVRRRMQLSFHDDTKYKTIAGTLHTIFKEEGIKGYFKGISINWLAAPLAIGVSFGVFEVIRDFFVTNCMYKHY